MLSSFQIEQIFLRNSILIENITATTILCVAQIQKYLFRIYVFSLGQSSKIKPKIPSSTGLLILNKDTQHNIYLSLAKTF